MTSVGAVMKFRPMQRDELASSLLTSKRQSQKTVTSYAGRLLEMYAALTRPSDPATMRHLKWLKDETQILKWIEENKGSSLSNRKMYLQAAAAGAELGGFGSAAKAYMQVAYEHNQEQQEEKMKQTLSDTERQRYVTPLVLRQNVSVLAEALRQVGTSPPEGTSLDTFRNLWQVYPLMLLLTLEWPPGEERVFRADVGYTTHLLDMSTASPTDEWLQRENFIEFDPRHPGRPVRLQLNHYKTLGKGKGQYKHVPVTVMIGDKEWLKAFHDSYAAFPRSYLITSAREPEKQASDSWGSQIIKRWGWVLDDRAVGQRPGANEIRSSLATEFYDTHSTKEPRAKFAHRSMSSDYEMEISYFKAAESEVLKLFREDRKRMAGGVELSKKQKLRAGAVAVAALTGLDLTQA